MYARAASKVAISHATSVFNSAFSVRRAATSLFKAAISSVILTITPHFDRTLNSYGGLLVYLKAPTCHLMGGRFSFLSCQAQERGYQNDEENHRTRLLLGQASNARDTWGVFAHPVSVSSNRLLYVCRHNHYAITHYQLTSTLRVILLPITRKASRRFHPGTESGDSPSYRYLLGYN